MVSSLWQKAWDDAQLQLRSSHDSPESSPASQQRALRVGQLDAELLDAELAHVLQEPLAKALAAILPAFQVKFEPELALLIRLCLYKLSVWDVGTTYGAKLQDLSYIRKNFETKNFSSTSRLPRGTLIAHIILTILVPYFHSRIRSHALSNSWPDLPFADRRRKMWNVLNKLELLHSASTLLNFTLFLWSGRYRSISDRLTRMYLVPVRRLTNRQVSYEFMNRQMVWHAFTEFILLVLPLLRSRALRKAYYKIVSHARNFEWTSVLPMSSRHEGKKKAIPPKQFGRFAGLSEDQCAICAEDASFEILPTITAREADNSDASFNAVTSTFRSEISEKRSAKLGSVDNPIDSAEEPPKYPISTPYIASCGHVYCYLCIAERLIRVVDEGEDDWECLRCCQRVRFCQRTLQSDDSESVHTSDYWTSDEDGMISFRSEPIALDS